MNNGGGFWDDGLGIEQEQHHQGFEFKEDPLFRQHDHTMDEYTVVDDDAGNEGYASMDEADADAGDKKKKMQNTGGYTSKEEWFLCWALKAIIQDPFCAAE
jgi:hypothetical protein